MTLAASVAKPVSRLKNPKAVPRDSGGEASATRVANKPCVNPICRPHSATPRATPPRFATEASARSAPASKTNADPHAAPGAPAGPFDRRKTQWVFAPVDAGRPRRPLDRQQNQRQRQKCRNHRDPEHSLEIIRRPPHQADGE